MPDRPPRRAASSPRPSARLLLLALCAIVATACARSSAEPELAPIEPAPESTGAADRAAEATTPAPAPSSSITVEPQGGLADIVAAEALDWDTVGVTIDGVLRAVLDAASADAGTTLGSVWVPPGNHLVCAVEVPPGQPVVYWADEGPGATLAPESAPPGPACGSASGEVDSPGRLLPDNRIIAHYGTGKTENLGILGEGTPAEATARLVAAAAEYEPFGKPALPAFEFIATVATRLPEPSGLYTKPRPHHEIVPYFDQIRAAGGLLILDLQPGRGSFLQQAKALEQFLIQPDVHLALDPEWSMEEDEVPGKTPGKTDAATINTVLDYLDELVVRHGLPEKMLVVHQFQAAMVEDREEINDPPGVAVLFHIEAHGTPGAKLDTYSQLFVSPPFFNGFKVYFDEDSRVMTPTEVMAVDPQPLFVSYQ